MYLVHEKPVSQYVGIHGGGVFLFARWFILSAYIILIITGWAKVWEAEIGDSKLLLVTDPILGITFRRLLLMAGVFELLIVFFSVLFGAQKLSLLLIAWFSSSVLVYRIGLWWVGWHSPCGCLGSLTEALYINPQSADTAMKAILAYLLIGSYAALFWLWCQRKKVSISALSQ